LLHSITQAINEACTPKPEVWFLAHIGELSPFATTSNSQEERDIAEDKYLGLQVLTFIAPQPRPAETVNVSFHKLLKLGYENKHVTQKDLFTIRNKLLVCTSLSAYSTVPYVL
jgi:hypothetical protein